MTELKEVVDTCGIGFKRRLKRENERRILDIKYLMSELSVEHHIVSRYAYLLNNNEYYSKKKELTPEEEKEFYEGQVEMLLLENDLNVQIYNALREEILQCEKECKDYYKTINVDFREQLHTIDVPEIYVYQGVSKSDNKLKLSRHIMLGDVEESYYDTPNIVIYPIYDKRSNRATRHFYNDVSFKYLEQLSQDLDFNPKVKKLGRVNITGGK